MGMGRATGSVESDARTDFFLDRASGGVHRLAGELLFGEAERLHANTNGRVLSVILVTFDVRIDTSHQASGNWRNIAITLIWPCAGHLSVIACSRQLGFRQLGRYSNRACMLGPQKNEAQQFLIGWQSRRYRPSPRIETATT